MAKVLVIGSGGREHALAWKLSQSPKVDKVFVAPGNGGTGQVAENVDIGFTNVDGLLKFAQDNKIDLTVIGQEAAAEAGAVDAFQKAGLTIFGPTKAAIKIESSKAFSKDLMKSTKVPTAQYQNFTDPAKALTYIKTRSYPIVIKADGLAEGKGVIIAQNQAEAEAALDKIMTQKAFGASGNTVVVEDFLKGQEVSAHALCDGQQAVLFPISQDHKQVNDHDQGPNTGGMGVFAPVPWITPDHVVAIHQQIVEPILEGLAAKQATFTGCLYPGLMIDGDQPSVVEFNARFGDPEAEAYMRLFDGDLYQILLDCTKGQLDPGEASQWKSGSVVAVAVASGGYPGSYEKGLPITGLDKAVKQPDIEIFHAGTKQVNGDCVTNGGRVLYVTATGKDLNDARQKAYTAIKLIHFDKMHYRTDIGLRPAPTK